MDCNDCAFLTDEAYVVAPRLYTNISFRETLYPSRRITHGMPICKARLEIIRGPERFEVIVDDPSFLNRNNLCTYYQEKIRISNLILDLFLWFIVY